MIIPPGEATRLPKSNVDRSRNNSGEDEKGLLFSPSFSQSTVCLEEKNHGKVLRIPLTRTNESRWIGPVITQPEKSLSPPRTNPPPENHIDAKKFNSPNDASSFQASKNNSSYLALEPDTEVRFSSIDSLIESLMYSSF